MLSLQTRVIGIFGSISRVKTRNIRANRNKRFKMVVLSSFLIFSLLAVIQTSQAKSIHTLNSINYSEIEAINKGMGLVQVSATHEEKKVQFASGVKAYSEQEYALAKRIFEPLAIHGHSASQYYLGVLYDMGVESHRNSRVAYQWYRLAALTGDDRAQHNLAVAYAKGDGVEANLKLAMKWWMLSSLQGNADSQYNLGILYTMGQGTIEKNIVKAMKWWRKAATSGDAVAQFNLGTIYANGDSGNKNYCEAERWWVQSAEGGFSQASFALNILRQRRDYYSCD